MIHWKWDSCDVSGGRRVIWAELYDGNALVPRTKGFSSAREPNTWFIDSCAYRLSDFKDWYDAALFLHFLHKRAVELQRRAVIRLAEMAGDINA